jgi:hypothetical protein
MQKLCAKCGAAMTCQPEGGCWCAELPPIPLPPNLKSTGCLCRICLLEKIKAAEASLLSGSTENKTS